MCSTSEYWHVQLDEAASRELSAGSLHVFAEGAHSDVRGQIYNMSDDSEVALPNDLWPHHLFIVIGIAGKVDALIGETRIELRPFSQLVVLPGVACRLVAASRASVELVSLLSMPPAAALAR
jgi:hypothetical protein